MRANEKYGAWPVLVALIAIIIIDILIVMSIPAKRPQIAYGRIVIGGVLQLISLGFFVAVRAEMSDEKIRSPSYYYAIPIVIRILIPFLVVSGMGASLVFRGLHEGDVPIPFRGQNK